MNESEQYKLDGICEKCRRVDYCNKECNAKKKRIEHETNVLVNSLLRAALPGPFAEEAIKWTEFIQETKSKL